ICDTIGGTSRQHGDRPATRSGDRAHRRFARSRFIRFSRRYAFSARGHEPGANMNKAQELHKLGQSLWLDNITRELLDKGTLRRYIDELSVTRLACSPTNSDDA